MITTCSMSESFAGFDGTIDRAGNRRGGAAGARPPAPAPPHRRAGADSTESRLMRGSPLSSRAPVGLAGEHEYAAAVHTKTMGEALMAQDELGQRGGAEAVLRWRAPLETVALILLAATGVSIVGGIVNGVFTGPATGGEGLR